MHRFSSYDGTDLAFRILGTGAPLIVLPGGPMRASEYLGDLGGLGEHRSLIIMDNRGTGASAVPVDPSTYRVDRLVDDVEALRLHLGLEGVDLLGHSAGGGTALLYAAAHPSKVTGLVLNNASFAAIGLESGLQDDVVMAERSHEPWYEDAISALHAGRAAPSLEEYETFRFAHAPLLYGKWTAVAQAHAAADPSQRSIPGTKGFYAGYVPDPVGLRDALAAVSAPVLAMTGEHDIWPTRFAIGQLSDYFTDFSTAVVPVAGHYPWIDNPAGYLDALLPFLKRLGG
jgi:pimeloyl-ACP methyl ester carboxylesterase